MSGTTYQTGLLTGRLDSSSGRLDAGQPYRSLVPYSEFTRVLENRAKCSILLLPSLSQLDGLCAPGRGTSSLPAWLICLAVSFISVPISPSMIHGSRQLLFRFAPQSFIFQMHSKVHQQVPVTMSLSARGCQMITGFYLCSMVLPKTA